MVTTRKRSYSASDVKAKRMKKANSVPIARPDSAFAASDHAKVYIADNGPIWDTSLTLSNVSGNNNKFYNIQVLIGPKGKQQDFWCHARWGRMGDHGQSKTQHYSTLDEAKADFEKKFKSKTGFRWADRFFATRKDMYNYVQKSYHTDDDSDGSDTGSINDHEKRSSLDLPTQRVMNLIFNEKHFDAVLEKIGYNKDKTPLGQLSKDNLRAGLEHLKELASLVRHPSLAMNKYNRDRKEVIEEWTNKYYATIPHNFGKGKPPAIDNHDIITREVAMLDALSDMGVANTIMRAPAPIAAKDKSIVTQLDQQFESLNLKEFAHLHHDSGEYQTIQKLLLNTSSDSHRMRYRLQDIFRVERDGEAERHEKAMKKVKNAQPLLLWYGARATNYASILSEGLKVPAADSPSLGLPLGKGIYMTDCSSLAMKRAMPELTGMVGILLLVEAGLPKDMYSANQLQINLEQEAKKLGYTAAKSSGSEVPGRWASAGDIDSILKNVLMPVDKLKISTPHGRASQMNWNQYVSYDATNVRIRYLLKIGL